MAVASKKDLGKKQNNLAVSLKKLENPETGKQKRKALINMVRASLRDSWMKSPSKLAYMELGVVPDNDPSTRTIWKNQCEHCLQWFKKGELECDHIEGNHTFKEVEDFTSYFDNILDIEWSDLQRLCKSCHGVKTYKESEGLPDMETAAKYKCYLFLVKVLTKEEVVRLLEHFEIVPQTTIAKRKTQLQDWFFSVDIGSLTYLKVFETQDYLFNLQKKKNKAKAFKFTQKDIEHRILWSSFWQRLDFTPRTLLSVIDQ